MVEKTEVKEDRGKEVEVETKLVTVVIRLLKKVDRDKLKVEE
jgi:hypothetical protein